MCDNGDTKWTADMASTALEDWAKKEIVESGTRFEAFLRFFFGISLFSIAAYVAILKLYSGQSVNITNWFYFAIVLYIASMLSILLAALRRTREFGQDTVLHTEHSKDFSFYQSRMWIWFGLWIAALICSGLSIYL